MRFHLRNNSTLVKTYECVYGWLVVCIVASILLGKEQTIVEVSGQNLSEYADSANSVDLHFTILHQRWIDYEKLVFQHTSRNFRLTEIHGRFARSILA
jgi:hypothetical protein